MIGVIDIQMPLMDGIETTRRIAPDPALADVHVVMLTNYGMDEYVLDALRAGATGFLVKDILPEDFAARSARRRPRRRHKITAAGAALSAHFNVLRTPRSLPCPIIMTR